jgi:glutaredoxin 3
VNSPILYVKSGCPHCKLAMDYLDRRKIEYTKLDVLGDATLMRKLKDLSGQTKTPTLDWDGSVLADFGIEELEKFLQNRVTVS